MEAFHIRRILNKGFLQVLEGNLPCTNSSLLWLGMVPPRVKAFCWLAISGKISTVDNFRRRGLTTSSISDTCVMCHIKEESVNHLFLHCEVAVGVWGHFIGRCGVAWCCPEKIAVAAESWMGWHFLGSGRTLWMMVPFAILWSIWRENDRILWGDFSSLTGVD